MIKSALRERVLNAADAYGSPRWNYDIGGEVDLWIGATMDEEWRRILDASAYYRVRRVTITSDAAGYYNISDLSTATQRLNKVIAFTVDNIVYEETTVKKYVLAPTYNSAVPQYLWWFEGEQIFAMPIQASKAAIVLINHIPPRYENIAAEADTVTWPDGYEQVLVWSAAAKLLDKGGVESGPAVALKMNAAQARDDMLTDLKRRSLAPGKMLYADSSMEWAG